MRGVYREIVRPERTVYTETFDGMPGAWQTLFDWCTAEKLALAGINWEIYMPWQGIDPAKLETDLYALLA